MNPNYKLFPLKSVQHEAKKILSDEQLRAAIEICKLLKHYPEDVGLSFEPCGEGYELHIEHPVINKQGWLRGAFWIHEKSRSIYIVDLFWKKENRVSKVDILRINDRIRKLRQQLG